MIIRIVKMTFDPSKLHEFREIFNSSKEKIRNFEGCSHLELLNDINNPNIFFTYSHWVSEQALNNYRDSDLFKKTWAKTRMLFSEEAEASSLVVIYKK